jgi:hypothetical protein
MPTTWAGNQRSTRRASIGSATAEQVPPDWAKKTTDDYGRSVISASLPLAQGDFLAFSNRDIPAPRQDTAVFEQIRWVATNKEVGNRVQRHADTEGYNFNFNREMLDKLAVENPLHLLEIVDSDILEPPLLTYAAEYLGEIENEGLAERVVETLLRLTENSSALVREGAIYGLEDYLDRPNVAERLTTIATTDPSAGVRAAAQEALEA